ncbi:MAG: cell division protein FtsQ [Odoribacteraceae bacterium]|jgi:cell division protein FtsQ|nr:cell division protein FtsQ [Odoribacteraceae bacterium]
MKRSQLYIISIILLVYLIIILTFAAAKWGEVTCRGVRVTVDDARNAFVDDDEVMKWMQKGYGAILDKKIATIDKDSLERVLAKNPMITSAQVYYSLDGYVYVNIGQREPVLRVMAGEGYYVDRDGQIMPLSSKFTSRVIVATGNISQTFACERLAPFVKDLVRHAFWNAFIEQVVVLPNGDVVLIPKVGDFKITLGPLEGYEERMEKLMIFLKRGIKKGGWDCYKEIKLKFDKQIVCVRRKI